MRRREQAAPVTYAGPPQTWPEWIAAAGPPPDWEPDEPLKPEPADGVATGRRWEQMERHRLWSRARAQWATQRGLTTDELRGETRRRAGLPPLHRAGRARRKA